MKKTLAILLALAMALSLAACGGKDAPAPSGSQGGDAPLTREDGSSENTTPNIDDDVPEVDMGAIMGGATDTVWGKQDEATKQAIIADAKNDGVDVSFGADGSMTVVDTDGSVMVQNPDGTWSCKDEDSGEAQIGGGWPDNEFTKLLPAPKVGTIGAAEVTESECMVIMTWTAQEAKEYTVQVKDAGFDQNAEEQDMTDMGIYVYIARNASNAEVSVSFMSGTGGISITKP